MNNEEDTIDDLQYVVMLYDPQGICSVTSKEGNTFPIAMPFKVRSSANNYIKTIEEGIEKKGILFHRVK